MLFITHSVDEAVTLGDRIMVMTAQPGRAKAIIDVPFPRPRNVLELRAEPAYGELVYNIWGQLRDEVLAAKANAEAVRMNPPDILIKGSGERRRRLSRDTSERLMGILAPIGALITRHCLGDDAGRA